MPIVGNGAVERAIKNLKPAVQQTLKPILERVQKNSVFSGGDDEKIPAKPAKNAAPEEDDDPPPQNSFAKAAAKKAEPKKDLNSSLNNKKITKPIQAPTKRNQ